MSKHTPGPWHVAIDDHERSLIATVGNCGGRIFGRKFDVPANVNYESHGSEEADAVLCAAAPELYDALSILAGTLPHIGGNARSIEILVLTVGNALAKARGES